MTAKRNTTDDKSRDAIIRKLRRQAVRNAMSTATSAEVDPFEGVTLGGDSSQLLETVQGGR